MSTTKRVLVLGAGGMIGRAIQEEACRAEELELLPASHRDRPGHLHIDYFPGHAYLAEGSLSLVVNSPHGGMPLERGRRVAS